MRITPITMYNSNIVYSNQNNKCTSVPLNKLPDKHIQNSPSFGRFIIDNIYNWSIRKTNQHNAERVCMQVKQIRKETLDDVELLAKRQGVSRESIEKKYGQAIKKGGIPIKYDGNEFGLNKVVGYSLEKLEFLRKVVVPVMESAEAKKNGQKLSKDKKIPGGIIIYGRSGSGKYFMADSLLEHLNIKAQKSELPIETMKIDGEWWKGDTKENIDALKDAFNTARENGKNGKHTVLLIDRMNELLTAENGTQLKQEFVNQTKNPLKDSFTWIGTVDNIRDVSRPFFLPKRTNLFVQFDKTKSEPESLALFQHFIANTNRESLYDQKYILDYTRNSNIPITPKKIKQIVKFADDELRMTEDYESKEKGIYKAPIYNMQLMMGVDYVAKYNKNIIEKPIKEPTTLFAPKELYISEHEPFIENV